MYNLELYSTETEEDIVIKRYACEFVVETAGDGLWGCEAGRQVTVSGITVIEEQFEGETYKQVNVTHDSTWDIYTDSAFEDAISNALGFDVTFTEQGMQEDGVASME